MLRKLVKRKLRQAGIRGDLSAHSFRVATITDLISRGVPIEDVQQLAAHTDARTTKLYDRTNRKASLEKFKETSVCPASKFTRLGERKDKMEP